MSVVEIYSNSQFDSLLNDTSATYKYLFVDFYAIWCVPCKRIAPKIKEYAQERPDIKFVKIDVDNLRELAAAYGVTAVPTFKVFKVGSSVPLYEIVGGNEKQIVATLGGLY